MKKLRVTGLAHLTALGAVFLGIAACGAEEAAEDEMMDPAEVTDPAAAGLPNPTPNVIKDWAPLPDGREWGSTAGIDIDPIDGHIWAYDRCGGIALAGGCAENIVDPVFKFHRETGEVLASFGADLFVLPHGIHVDDDGNVWITDSMGTLDQGHTVVKFSPEGEYIMEWGVIGDGPGEFRTPHALEFDSQGRLWVADRGNHRIQIFDQEGNLLDTHYQYGRVSGLYIDDEDNVYAIDSESNPNTHSDWLTGVRIGHASEDVVTAFIPPHESDDPQGEAGEGVAVDADGNVYAAEGPNSRAAAEGGITKYTRN